MVVVVGLKEHKICKTLRKCTWPKHRMYECLGMRWTDRQRCQDTDSPCAKLRNLNLLEKEEGTIGGF